MLAISEHKDSWEIVSWTTPANRKLFMKPYILGFGKRTDKIDIDIELILLNPNNSSHKDIQELNSFPSPSLQNNPMYSLHYIPCILQHQQ